MCGAFFNDQSLLMIQIEILLLTRLINLCAVAKVDGVPFCLKRLRAANIPGNYSEGSNIRKERRKRNDTQIYVHTSVRIRVMHINFSAKGDSCTGPQ